MRTKQPQVCTKLMRMQACSASSRMRKAVKIRTFRGTRRTRELVLRGRTPRFQPKLLDNQTQWHRRRQEEVVARQQTSHLQPLVGRVTKIKVVRQLDHPLPQLPTKVIKQLRRSKAIRKRVRKRAVLEVQSKRRRSSSDTVSYLYGQTISCEI